jgi:hypothetical protein
MVGQAQCLVRAERTVFPSGSGRSLPLRRLLVTLVSRGRRRYVGVSAVRVGHLSRSCAGRSRQDTFQSPAISTFSLNI